jgi:hypothetical protein
MALRVVRLGGAPPFIGRHQVVENNILNQGNAMLRHHAHQAVFVLIAHHCAERVGQGRNRQDGFDRLGVQGQA